MSIIEKTEKWKWAREWQRDAIEWVRERDRDSNSRGK